MKSAIYFPILRGKEGEIDAIGHLSPYARLRVRPLFDIQKPRSPAKSSIEQFLADKAREIASAWGTTRPLFIDFRRYGPARTPQPGFTPPNTSLSVVGNSGYKPSRLPDLNQNVAQAIGTLMQLLTSPNAGIVERRFDCPMRHSWIPVAFKISLRS